MKYAHIFVLLIVIVAILVPINVGIEVYKNVAYAQPVPVPTPEVHGSPFGPIMVYEIKRENEPNLICYGYPNSTNIDTGNKLVGCVVRP